jgi:hypothetical protein
MVSWFVRPSHYKSDYTSLLSYGTYYVRKKLNDTGPRLQSERTMSVVCTYVSVNQSEN